MLARRRVGRVDDEHLFYLRSRGVPEAAAKRLIVMGFLQEVLAQVTLGSCGPGSRPPSGRSSG